MVLEPWTGPPAPISGDRKLELALVRALALLHLSVIGLIPSAQPYP